MKTIHIDGPIGSGPGEVSAKWFKSQLPADGSPVQVKFHSEGGSLFEAFAIYDAVAAYRGRKEATVEAMAFSAASLLLCAFDHVSITPNGFVMVHAPHMDGKDASPGERQLLANLREKMVAIYSAKTRQSADRIAKILNAEVFYDAAAAVELGIVDAVAVPSMASPVARRLPPLVLARLKASKDAKPATATARWQAAVVALGSVRAVEKRHPGLRQQMIREANNHKGQK